jgi:hypothetical protein
MAHPRLNLVYEFLLSAASREYDNASLRREPFRNRRILVEWIPPRRRCCSSVDEYERRLQPRPRRVQQTPYPVSGASWCPQRQSLIIDL